MAVVFVPSIIFSMTFSKKNFPCGLTNDSNVCWANSSIQMLCSFQELYEFLRKQTQHKNNKIRALANIFARYEQRFVFNASSFYKIIFKEANHIVIGEPQKVQDALEILLTLINDNFPDENFFLDKKMNIKLLDYDISQMLKDLKNEVDDKVLSTSFMKKINFVKSPPKSICLNVIWTKNNSRILLQEFFIKKSRYRLAAVIVEGENTKRRFTGIRFHSFAFLKRKEKWFLTNDDYIEEIEEKDYSKRIFGNKDINFALYTIVE